MYSVPSEANSSIEGMFGSSILRSTLSLPSWTTPITIRVLEYVPSIAAQCFPSGCAASDDPPVADTEAPLETRLAACAHMTDTFFYRKTSIHKIRALLEDPATPQDLRAAASHAQYELQRQ